MDRIEVFRNTYRIISQHSKNILIQNIQLMIYKNEMDIHKVLFNQNPICKYSHNPNYTIIESSKSLLSVLNEISEL